MMMFLTVKMMMR